MMQNLRRFKHPRTYHLPYSPGISPDDLRSHSDACFLNKEVVITEKMDGENTTLYGDGYMHCRSLFPNKHYSRDFVKNDWVRHAYLLNEINPDIRICVENLYTLHSIPYKDLPAYYLVFSAWKNETCLSWKDTVELCKKLSLQPVPVLYAGIYSSAIIKTLTQQLDTETHEGFVVRSAGEFPLPRFSENVLKYVRKNHVKTDKHWKASVTTNEMRKEDLHCERSTEYRH